MKRALAILILIAAAVFAPQAAPAAAAPGHPPIRHVWVIVLENKEFAEWYGVGRPFNPYLTSTLASQGVLIPNYFGIGHSSADNYIGMISGQPPTADSKNDCPDPMTEQPAGAGPNGVAPANGCVYPAGYLTIGDQLTRAHRTWKAYAQTMPSPCFPGRDAGQYRRKHNAFIYFRSVVDSGQCARDDVPLIAADGTDNLAHDLRHAHTTPSVNYIFPDQCGDGHSDCTGANPVPLAGAETDEMSQYDAFLHKYVPLIESSPAFHSGLLFITFDEGDDPFGCCGEPSQDPDGSYPGGVAGSPGWGGGQVGAIAISPFIKPGTVSSAQYNHYSLLASIENLFGLPHLADASLPGVTTFGSDVYSNPPVGPTKNRARRRRTR